MQLHGFQGLRTDKVITDLSITKGAFYHYFPDKTSVGYAVLDEILKPTYLSIWSDLLEDTQPVYTAIANRLRLITTFCSQENIHLGCPVNNLIQEMSPLDEGFRIRLCQILDGEIIAIENALLAAQAKGLISADTNCRAMADYILAALNGCYTIGKVFNSFDKFKCSMDMLIDYVQSQK